MTGPGDEIAAGTAGGGHLGVGRAFASRTYAELAALTADLPAGPAAPGALAHISGW